MDIVQRYGLDLTGQQDNAPRLAALAADIGGLHAAGKPLPRLTFPEGILAFSAWPDLAYDNLQIVAEGECRLMAGGDIVFDASLRNPAAQEPGIRNLTFTGFDIYGGGLVFRGIHRSHLAARVEPAGGPAIRMTFCIITDLHPVVRGGGAGVLVEAWPGKPMLQSTACTVANPCLEGCEVGLDVQSAGSCMAYGGTIESCGLGVRLGSGAGNNLFYSVEMEGNNEDVRADSGAHANGFLYCGNNGKLNTNFNFSSNWSRN